MSDKVLPAGHGCLRSGSFRSCSPFVVVRTWLAGGEREIKGRSKAMWFKMKSLPESDKEREETIVKQVIDGALLPAAR